MKWNPWHGCHKISPGCLHCYVYRMDARHDKDSSVVTKTQEFNLPLRKNRAGEWKIPSGTTVYTCFTSDFLVEDADGWREEAWAMMRERRDLRFFFITKRIARLQACLPKDWGDGWEHVAIACTVEDQDRADFRLPIYMEAPIRHKYLCCEPLLGPIDLTQYLGPDIEGLICGGESGLEARVCDYDWILALREQCVAAGVPFTFKQTGARLRKDGRIYQIERKLQHVQAKKANINYRPRRELAGQEEIQP